MAPKAFETNVYALGTAFGVSQPHASTNVDHLYGTFTLAGHLGVQEFA
jgi:hypothetical protein